MADATEKHVRVPSKAKYVDGQYIADRDNQPLAYANTGAHDLGQLKHPFGKPTYCVQHCVLGCVECNG